MGAGGKLHGLGIQRGIVGYVKIRHRHPSVDRRFRRQRHGGQVQRIDRHRRPVLHHAHRGGQAHAVHGGGVLRRNRGRRIGDGFILYRRNDLQRHGQAKSLLGQRGPVHGLAGVQRRRHVQRLGRGILGGQVIIQPKGRQRGRVRRQGGQRYRRLAQDEQQADRQGGGAPDERFAFQ